MTLSYIVWGIVALLFLAVEMLGVFHVFGWVSLSETAWALEKVSIVIKAVVLAGLIVLTSHLCLGWPH
jgi:hypothetical protein